MKDLLGRVSYWKMAILKVSIQAGISAATSFLAATQAVDWKGSSGFTKFCLIMGALVVAGGVVNAFCDQTLGQLKRDAEEGTEVVQPTTTGATPHLPPGTAP